MVTTKICPICDGQYEVKLSQFQRRVYCSKECQGQAFSSRYKDKHNPNYKGGKVSLNSRFDVYKVPHHITGKSIAIHKAVVCEFFNILPEQLDGHKFNIHHKDSDVLNNTVDNLVLIEPSDHKWLHHEFGNAILFNIFKTKQISIQSALSWSKDLDRAERLLNLHLENQHGLVTNI